MKRLIVANAIVLLMTNAVFAQQPPTTAIDRIAYNLGQCIKEANVKVDEVAALQLQLNSALERIKELEKNTQGMPKDEPKKEN